MQGCVWWLAGPHAGGFSLHASEWSAAPASCVGNSACWRGGEVTQQHLGRKQRGSEIVHFFNVQTSFINVLFNIHSFTYIHFPPPHRQTEKASGRKVIMVHNSCVALVVKTTQGQLAAEGVSIRNSCEVQHPCCDRH